jgi:hypothetical protein
MSEKTIQLLKGWNDWNDWEIGRQGDKETRRQGDKEIRSNRLLTPNS